MAAPTKPKSGRKGAGKPASTLARAVRLLARRDMSRAELLARLSPRPGPRDDGAVPPDDAAESSHAQVGSEAATGADELHQVLDRLQSLGLQSDQRFADNYVRGRQARTGSRRLAAELRQRGVDAEAATEALREAADSELERARALWARKFSYSRDPAERARQMRFLASRGFDLGVIRGVVGSAPDDAPIDDPIEP